MGRGSCHGRALVRGSRLRQSALAWSSQRGPLSPVALLAEELDVTRSVAASHGNGDDVIEFKAILAPAVHAPAFVSAPNFTPHLGWDTGPTRRLGRCRRRECLGIYDARPISRSG